MFVSFCRCFLPNLLRLNNIHFRLGILAEMFMLSMMKAGKAENFEDKRNLEVKQKTKIKPTYQSQQGIGSKSSMKVKAKLRNEKKWKHAQMWKSFFSLSVSWRAKGQNIRHNSDPAEVSGIIRTSNMADFLCWTKQVKMKFKTINCTYRTARVRHAPYCHQPLQIIPAKDPSLQNRTEDFFCLCSR